MKNLKYALVLLIIGLITHTGLSQQAPSEDRTLIRVLSYKVLHGATTRGDNDLDMVAKVINSVDPDLIALQEIDFKTNRVQNRDISTELAFKTDMVPMFARAVDYDGGQYGQSLFSRWGFLQTGKVDLPGSADKEPRIAADAKIILPSGDTLRFIGTHLDHLRDSPDRIAQAEKINKMIDGNNYPVILAGDLNDVPESKTISIFESKWTASYDKTHPGATVPSHAPRKKIDYVMFYPAERWRVIEKEVICDEIASDHCAYLVVLELLPKS